MRRFRGASLERARIGQWFSGTCAQRGFQAAELLPLVAMVLAGPRSRQFSSKRVNIVANYDQAVREAQAHELKLPSVVSLKTFVKPSTHPAFRGSTCSCATASPAPILRRPRGPDLRSPAATRSRGELLLVDQHRHRLLALQFAQGQSDAARGQDVALADAVPAFGPAPASQRAIVSAELSARKLARLSLLGYRAGALSRSLAAEPRHS